MNRSNNKTTLTAQGHYSSYCPGRHCRLATQELLHLDARARRALRASNLRRRRCCPRTRHSARDGVVVIVGWRGRPKGDDVRQPEFIATSQRGPRRPRRRDAGAHRRRGSAMEYVDLGEQSLRSNDRRRHAPTDAHAEKHTTRSPLRACEQPYALVHRGGNVNVASRRTCAHTYRIDGGRKGKAEQERNVAGDGQGSPHAQQIPHSGQQRGHGGKLSAVTPPAVEQNLQRHQQEDESDKTANVVVVMGPQGDVCARWNPRAVVVALGSGASSIFTLCGARSPAASNERCRRRRGWLHRHQGASPTHARVWQKLRNAHAFAKSTSLSGRT
jgi:hypothetical protein